MNPAGISVIIACYNSASVIHQTLLHLQKQENTQNITWEVILIDNNCTDNTAQLAQESWGIQDSVPLHIIKETQVGEASARKAGIIKAKYAILSIVDDDNRVNTNWISSIYSYFENPEIGLLGCVGIGDFESEPPAWFDKHQHAFAIGSLYAGDFTDITADAIVPGAGLSVRKEIFDILYSINWKPFLTGRVGNRQSAGADSEICYVTRLLGYKIYYSNLLAFKHYTKNDRITWERLENMFAGFGAADVFTLPYKLLYAKEKGQTGILDGLRRTWWFNYFGKKTVNTIRYCFFAKSTDIKTLMNIRNKAFCEVMLQNKVDFENSFAYLEQIKTKAKTLVKT